MSSIGREAGPQPWDTYSKTETDNLKVAKVSSTDNAIVRFDGTSGAVQNSSVVIDDSGNVGIGTSSPSSNIHSYNTAAYIGTQGITSQSDTNTITLGAGSSSSTAYATNYMGTDEAGINTSCNQRFNIYGSGNTFKWTSAGVERMRIDSSGNVGIGVTPSAWNSGFKAIDIGTYSAISDGDGGCGGASIYGNAYSTVSGTWLYKQSYYATLYRTNYAGQHQWFTAPSGTAGNAISFIAAMTLDASGNLKFNSGYGSVATAYGCRAWVNFNGTGTVAIRASGNVSSITDNGTGVYTVNFATAMPDINYNAPMSAEGSGASGSLIIAPYTSGTYTTTAFQLYAMNYVGNGTDSQKVSVSVFR